MIAKNVCLHWQAPGLPFDSDMRGAVAAFHDGRDYALELLGYTSAQQANMARAALCGFLAPLLPVLADALCLLAGSDHNQSSHLAALLDDLADGAPLALELASMGEY